MSVNIGFATPETRNSSIIDIKVIVTSLFFFAVHTIVTYEKKKKNSRKK